MTASEAFETLGLSPDADARAIKRAYHKLLKRHKPDSDPEGFRRVRDAFEVASDAEAMRAFEAGFDGPVSSSEDEEPDGEDEPEDLPAAEEPESDVSPDVVHDALDRGELRWAYELVMDDRWAAAMLDEHGDALRWATRRVGLWLVLRNRPAFDVLASKYPDAFEMGDAQLVYLQRISGEWTQLAARLAVPPALVAFITRVPLEDDPAVCRDLARALGEWFQRDVDRGMKLLDAIAQRSNDVGPFLCELIAEFDPELDADASGEPPAKTLRMLTWPAMVLAIVVPVAALVLAGLGDDTRFEVLRLFGVLFGGVIGVMYGEGAVYEALPSLRRRFLLACIEAGVEPSLAAVGLSPHYYLRQAIQQDAGLDLAFRIGRLAQLGG